MPRNTLLKCIENYGCRVAQLMHVLRDCKDGKFDRSTVKSKTKLKGQTTVPTVDCFREKGVIELTEQGSSITLENVSFEDCLLERKIF